MQRKWKGFLAVPISLLILVQLPGCDFFGCELFEDYDCDDPPRIQSIYKVRNPEGINCFDYSGKFSIADVVLEDFETSAQFIRLPGGITIWIYYNAKTGQTALFSTLAELNGLRGTGTPTQTGLQFSLSSNQLTSAGMPTTGSFTFEMVHALSGMKIQNGKLRLIPAVDKQGVLYGVTGTQATATLPYGCGAQGLSSEPVALATGEYLNDPEADLNLGGLPELLFRRHYGSLLKVNGVSGALGDNWMHSFEMSLSMQGSTQVTVILFGGATMVFNKSGNNWVLEDPQPLAYQLVQSGTNYQFLDAASGLIYTFNASGQLIRMEDRNGNALTLTQSGAGPTQISDGQGRTLTLAYDTNGRLISVKDQTGRTVSFTYTGTTLTGVTDANGTVTTYAYTNVSTAVKTSLLTTIKRPAGNTTLAQSYDADGRVLRQVDGVGNATLFAYDNPAPGTTSVTDPLGNKTQVTHPNLIVRSQEVDANGKATGYVYDAANRPTQITDPLGNKTVMAYDPASGRVGSRTDGAGSKTTSSYTAQQQAGLTFYVQSATANADGTGTSSTYDAKGNLLTATDENGKTWKFGYTPRGLVATAQNPAGGVTSYIYNGDNTRMSLQTPAGDVTGYEYDAQKRLNRTTYPDAATETFAYDARDRLTQHTFGIGPPQSYAYDDNGNLRSASDASGIGATMAYDADDRPVSVTWPAGTRTVTYDAASRPATLVNEAGERTTFSFDAAGHPLAALDGSGNGTHAAWNAAGVPQSLTDALAKTTAFLTDPLGRVMSATTPLNEKYSFAYDNVGSLAAFTSPMAHVVKFAHDRRGALSRMDAPAGISAAYAYSDLGQVSTITDPNGSLWTQSWDNMGRFIGLTDPLMRASSVQYDSRNRPRHASNALGSVDVTVDSRGNPTRIAFSDGTALNYQYGPGGVLLSADNLALGVDLTGAINASNGIGMVRDGARRLVKITYGPGLVVTYKYDGNGLLVEVDDWVGGATTLQWNAAHQLIGVKRPNQTATQYARDANGELTGKTFTTADGNYTIALQLDAEHKVVSADRNLPLAAQPTGGFNGYSFDAAHQIANATYDAMGRILSDGVRTYVWDMASRLVSYSGVDGAAQFAYDALGLRVSRTTSDGEQDYVWNYGHDMPVVAIVRSGGADVRYFIYTPDGALLHSIEAADNSRRYYNFDEAGSTAFTTGDDGSVADAFAVSPFGESVTRSGTSDVPFTFHGLYGVMQEGATGLYYARARYYDSVSQRFLSPDPVHRLEATRIDPYPYALNNPISLADPTGRDMGEPQTYCGPSSLGAASSSRDDRLPRYPTGMVRLGGRRGFQLFPFVPPSVQLPENVPLRNPGGLGLIFTNQPEMRNSLAITGRDVTDRVIGSWVTPGRFATPRTAGPGLPFAADQWKFGDTIRNRF